MAPRIALNLYKKPSTSSKQKIIRTGTPHDAGVRITMDYQSMTPTKLMIPLEFKDKHKSKDSLGFKVKLTLSDRARVKDLISFGYPVKFGDATQSTDLLALKAIAAKSDRTRNRDISTFKVKPIVHERIKSKESIEATMFATTYFAEDYVSEMYAVEPLWTVNL